MATKKPVTKKRLSNILSGDVLPPVSPIELRMGVVQAFNNAVDLQSAMVQSIDVLNMAIGNIVQAGIDLGKTKKPEKGEKPDPSVSFLNAMWFDFVESGRYTVDTAYQNTMLIRWCAINKLRVMPGLVNYNAFRKTALSTGVPSLEDPTKFVKVLENGTTKEVKPSKSKGKSASNGARSKRTDKPAWDGIILASTQEGFGQVMRLLVSEVDFESEDDEGLIDSIYDTLVSHYDALERDGDKIKVKK